MKGHMEFWGRPLVLYCTICNSHYLFQWVHMQPFYIYINSIHINLYTKLKWTNCWKTIRTEIYITNVLKHLKMSSPVIQYTLHNQDINWTGIGISCYKFLSKNETLGDLATSCFDHLRLAHTSGHCCSLQGDPSLSQMSSDFQRWGIQTLGMSECPPSPISFCAVHEGFCQWHVCHKPKVTAKSGT